jgi:hypothetical protein
VGLAALCRDLDLAASSFTARRNVSVAPERALNRESKGHGNHLKVETDADTVRRCHRQT